MQRSHEDWDNPGPSDIGRFRQEHLAQLLSREDIRHGRIWSPTEASPLSPEQIELFHEPRAMTGCIVGVGNDEHAWAALCFATAIKRAFLWLPDMQSAHDLIASSSQPSVLLFAAPSHF